MCGAIVCLAGNSRGVELQRVFGYSSGTLVPMKNLRYLNREPLLSDLRVVTLLTFIFQFGVIILNRLNSLCCYGAHFSLKYVWFIVFNFRM